MPFHYERRMSEETKERKTGGSSLTIKSKVSTISKGPSLSSGLKLKKYSIRDHESSNQEGKTPVSPGIDNPQLSHPYLLRKSEFEINEAEFDSASKVEIPALADKDAILKEGTLKKKKASNAQNVEKLTPNKKQKAKKKN